jgi:hypothetical protein
VLQQKYSAGLSDLAALSFPEALKGPDRLLAAALEQTGLNSRWECQFTAVTAMHQCHSNVLLCSVILLAAFWEMWL